MKRVSQLLLSARRCTCQHCCKTKTSRMCLWSEVHLRCIGASVRQFEQHGPSAGRRTEMMLIFTSMNHFDVLILFFQLQSD